MGHSVKKLSSVAKGLPKQMATSFYFNLTIEKYEFQPVNKTLPWNDHESIGFKYRNIALTKNERKLS